MDDSFLLFGNLEVIYRGRANSTIGPTNLLLIKKADGSVLIHGADLTTPRNYMSPGSKLEEKGETLIFSRKNESITVIIHEKLWVFSPLDWSSDKIVLLKTEEELRNKLIANPYDYFGINPIHIITEYPVETGKIDILMTNDHIADSLQGCHVHNIEVKRKKITINHCHQVMKYAQCLEESGARVTNWIAGPDISHNAKIHCEKHNIKYAYVDFSDEIARDHKQGFDSKSATGLESPESQRV